MNLRKVLVPTDFSESSEKAVNYAAELASKFGSELHVLHAFDTTPILYGEGGGMPNNTAAEVAAAASRMIENIEVKCTSPIEVKRTVREGHDFVEIIRFAKENEIDLIVMGTHGRGAVAHLLLGSVAEKVVRKAPCPVLVVRDKEHDFVMP